MTNPYSHWKTPKIEAELAAVRKNREGTKYGFERRNYNLKEQQMLQVLKRRQRKPKKAKKVKGLKDAIEEHITISNAVRGNLNSFEEQVVEYVMLKAFYIGTDAVFDLRGIFTLPQEFVDELIIGYVKERMGNTPKLAIDAIMRKDAPSLKRLVEEL